MWCSATDLPRAPPLGATYGPTPHYASGSRTRLHAFAHDPPYFKLIRLTSPK